MIIKSLKKRHFINSTSKIFAAVISLSGILILFSILFELFKNGASAFNYNFFFALPSPPGESEGGLSNSILGSFILVLSSSLISIPPGMMAGIYLSEIGKNNRISVITDFAVNTLMGIPSIVIGLFVYTLIVIKTGSFSGYAGIIALSVIMLPIITKNTYEVLKMVPNSLRESGMAIGIPKWRVTIDILFHSAKSGLITGIILSIARISGESAPLLFTSLNSPYWPENLSKPFPNLTVTIFNYAMSPYAEWQQLAWGGALLISITILIFSISARMISGRN